MDTYYSVWIGSEKDGAWIIDGRGHLLYFEAISLAYAYLINTKRYVCNKGVVGRVAVIKPDGTPEFL